jgi:hypothetical protein
MSQKSKTTNSTKISPKSKTTNSTKISPKSKTTNSTKISPKSNSSNTPLQSRPILGDNILQSPFHWYGFSLFQSKKKKDKVKTFKQMWKNKGADAMKYIKEEFLKEVPDSSGNWILPKGTKLYHTTFDNSLVFKKKIYPTFFGLDSELPLWYLLERLLMMRIKQDKPGYLYVYKVKDDLPITELWDSITDHPFTKKVCETKPNVCLHPQVSFRGSSKSNFYDVGIEITMFNPGDYLKLKNVYEVDIEAMSKQRDKRNYNVRTSIIKKIKI